MSSKKHKKAVSGGALLSRKTSPEPTTPRSDGETTLPHEASPDDLSPRPTSGTITVQPEFKRNPEAPVFYAQHVDVRTSPHGLNLLLFVLPAADPTELLEKQGEIKLPVLSTAELLLPLDAVEPMVYRVLHEYRSAIINRIKEEVTKAGLDLGDNIRTEWLDQMLNLLQHRMED